MTWPARTRHGTRQGYKAHALLRERPCGPCYQAQSQYDRNRAQTTARQRQQRLTSNAQAMALKLLREAHMDEYRALYEQAKWELENQDAREDDAQ